MNISYRGAADRIANKTCRKKKTNFIIIQNQDSGTTAHQGVMINFKNIYKERSVRYSVWRKKGSLWLICLFSLAHGRKNDVFDD